MRVAHLRRLTVADSRVYAFVLIGLAVAFVLTHAPEITLTADEAQWMTTVDKVLRGRVLIRDAVMAKGPYLTLWHVLATLVVGRNVIALHLAAVVWALMAGAAVVWFTARAWGRSAAAWCGVVFVCAMSHHGAHKGVYSEVLMVLPTALGMLCLLIGVAQRRRWLTVLAGVLGAAATLTKQVGAFEVMACYAALVVLVMIGHLSRREGTGLGVWYTAGGVLGCFPFVLYLIGNGILGEYLRGSALEPAGYISVVGLGDTARNLLGAVTAVIAPNAMVFIAGLGGLLLLWPVAVRRNGAGDPDACTSAGGAASVIACCWCIGAIIGIIAVRRFSVGHFVQFYPPAAVLDMDVRKYQECADVVLRLRAEYLLQAGRDEQIVFHLTGGGDISWPQWKQGMRPRYDGRRLHFARTGQPCSSRECFDAFLHSVYEWCGTLSLATEGTVVGSGAPRIGDFFVHGGSPGHGAIIVDLATDGAGRWRALLAHGYPLAPAGPGRGLIPQRRDAPGRGLTRARPVASGVNEAGPGLCLPPTPLPGRGWPRPPQSYGGGRDQSGRCAHSRGIPAGA
jgi:hypothetical protein